MNYKFLVKKYFTQNKPLKIVLMNYTFLVKEKKTLKSNHLLK